MVRQFIETIILEIVKWRYFYRCWLQPTLSQDILRLEALPADKAW